MTFGVLEVVARYGHADSHLLDVFGDIERRICLFLLLLFMVFIFLFEKFLKFPHFFGITTFVEVLKGGIFALGVFGVGCGARCQFFWTLSFEVGLVQDVLDRGSLVRSHSQNHFNHVNVLTICLITFIPNRSQK